MGWGSVEAGAYQRPAEAGSSRENAPANAKNRILNGDSRMSFDEEDEELERILSCGAYRKRVWHVRGWRFAAIPFFSLIGLAIARWSND